MTVTESMNNAKIEALKKVKQTQWVGEITHTSLEKSLIAINLFSGMNSGWYSPKDVKIKGLVGIFMINEDGGLFFESRVIKISDNEFKIEHLSNEGFKVFESEYNKIIGF